MSLILSGKEFIAAAPLGASVLAGLSALALMGVYAVRRNGQG